MSPSTSLRTTGGEADAESSHDPAGPDHAPVPDLIRQEREAVRSILELIADRATTETEIEETRRSRTAEADSEYNRKKQGLKAKVEQLDRDSRSGDEQRRRSIVEAATAGEAQAKTEFAFASRRIASEFDTLRETARASHARARSEATAQHEAGQKVALRDHAVAKKPVTDALDIAKSYRNRLVALAESYRKFGLDPEIPPPTRESYTKFASGADELFTRVSRMNEPLKLLEKLVIPKSLKGTNEAWVYVTMVALALTLAVLVGADLTVAAVLAGVGLVLALALRMWLVNLSKFQLERLYKPLTQSLADAQGLGSYCNAQVDLQLQEALKRLTTQQEVDLQRAKDDHARTVAQGETDRDEKLRKINEVYAQKLTDLQTHQAKQMMEAVQAHDNRMADLKSKNEAGITKLEDGYRAVKEQIRAAYENDRRILTARWREGLSQAADALDDVTRRARLLGVDWEDPEWPQRELPRSAPSALPFGTFAFDLAAIPHGLPADASLMEGLPSSFRLPALRAFPSSANLLVETSAEGRTTALVALQAAMTRILASVPPGMVRFTIIDPIGIGRNFGAFMHLADFDEALVNGQVWTDARQIEERLADLESHMELVTQKYLRNEYAAIEDYNAVAGEVAEPYRVLVVADFPTKFDEKAAARLSAIIAGGTPCGVLTMMAVDVTRELPTGCRLTDLRPYCTRLSWDDGKLVWDDDQLGGYPLKLDAPPAVDTATRLIQKIGEAARVAKRVEVPFEFIVPTPDSWWTGDSRSGIDVSLGKAGAAKRQNLTLGHGTSQHVLIAGRTGSGKSTLMHAMITNLALSYSPDEIDLYLIDFKKGVEFKVYATYNLPHASVVAIESEREFGISVLQRLDAELKIRADRFRDAGVQDIQGYRNAPGTPPLPRILLVVDEFQEFFVEEDKVAQEAALLLDRLVRQGRAFGIHIELGSQSLGGAFTLARSTLGQMGVRIALQCSDADSHLILSENNVAAKLLSRPGEAIYNDANGAPEGNHFFQVVWLSENAREDYLRKIRDLADERKPKLARTPIVFEGDAPAEVERNPALAERIEADAWPASPRSAMAWLGDPVAIKEPTSALFRRQGGNHLLIVGQNEEAALGVIASGLISLAVQFAPAESDTVRAGARFWVLDGTPEDHHFADRLKHVAEALPHGIKVGGWREAAAFLSEVAGELERRQQPEADDGPELFLFIHDLPRFRDLRRREDDFSFGRRDDDSSPPDQIDLILREGPGYGIHLIAWCDTVNNLNRCFTLQHLREFAMRVLFQMGPTDSGHLLDNPAASKLGTNRALFFSEEHNRLEKFRPYGLPSESWLSHIHDRLHQRS
ncbi:FtsK/SpoIIIE domain-containing protein [Paludisphaera borealis]|uniref:ESX-5 secretion system protein EccC5 n=1 Tax=Paludisphaera borealis TaxID=1387353 RepID=A0A1U7CMY8_9BACT|nr:FtsK/SpoIIIE domain-containing protein [Paludisphaera borealis]APW60314.1 ESX-5 secretion system protein EccC5 [Paludisphaera borealis]